MSGHRAPRPRPAAVAALTRAFDARTQRGQLDLAAVIVLVASLALALLLMRSDVVRQVASPPVPPSVTGPGTSAPSAAGSRSADAAKPFACRAGTASTFGGSAPTRICVPGIRVDASVMELGLNGDRTVQVPPLSRVQDAGWYKNSAAPGSTGATVVLGHVDSAQFGEGVFFDLARLHKGDRILVTRGDGKVAAYRVDRLQQVSKSSFPTKDVYGATSGAAIRLVTCGGRYDPSTGSYVDNIIVFGTLQSLRRG